MNSNQLAHDPHSFSEPNDVRVTHLDWDARVDFSSRIITATATYDLEHITASDRVVFDTRGLTVADVKVDGEPVEFEMGPEQEYLGQALVIKIRKDSKKVAIAYSTSPSAEALLWVEGEQPFLFTQSQAILARTWIPCQDSPGVRFTYNATVEVPTQLLALMSAENPQALHDDGVYTFVMEQAIPSYLMALAVGDLRFKTVGRNTGVYAIPSLIDAAAEEFSDMQAMVDAAEKLYGPYVWGRYDLLILPPAFPFGGMENPRLTFATPTIIAGDKSLTALVAHELAHSWSGNLVTNSTWNDFWLNEGFTVYFEQRIMEAVYGRETSEMMAQLSRQDLDATIEDLKDSPDDTHLKLKLEGRNPDDGMTDIAYNKGYFFLRLIEETVGRDKFDAYLKSYFSRHAFQVMDTERFVADIEKNLLSAEQIASIRLDAWIYGPGLPPNIPVVQSDRLANVDAVVASWSSGKSNTKDIPWNTWAYQEKYRFLSNLPSSVTADQLKDLDAAFKISGTGNNEVLFAWLEQAIKKQYTPAYPAVEKFLTHVGRRKFVAPLFEAMLATGQRTMAEDIYKKARPTYHAVTTGTVDAMLAEKK